jgi:hypothetical protein
MLGLYPIAGTTTYVLGSPSFPNATVSLGASPSASTLTIIAHNWTVTNYYVAKATINGVALTTPFIQQLQLVPSAFRPDCEQLLKAAARDSCLAMRAEALAAAARTQGTSVLEFFMTDAPSVWGTGARISAAEQPDVATVQRDLTDNYKRVRATKLPTATELQEAMLVAQATKMFNPE